jgi:hypothetical protein
VVHILPRKNNRSFAKEIFELVLKDPSNGYFGIVDRLQHDVRQTESSSASRFLLSFYRWPEGTPSIVNQEGGVADPTIMKLYMIALSVHVNKQFASKARGPSRINSQLVTQSDYDALGRTSVSHIASYIRYAVVCGSSYVGLYSANMVALS